MIPVQRTPLYEEHVRLGAKMAPFGGWEMPIQYRGILPEHEATRTASTMFDICHMGELEVKGPTATADLERLLTLSVSTLKPGQCRYGYLLRDDGGVLDDLTCYKFDDEHYWLVVNAATAGRDADWIRVHLSEETEFEDISSRIAKLDIQGPTSRQDIEKAIGAALPDLPYFYSEPIRVMGIDCLLSRTGYTGEWGYELYFPAAEAVSFWRLFLESGIQPAGLGARDTLRLEVGYPLYGHELRETQSPVAAARGNFIARDKAFIGKYDALDVEPDRKLPLVTTKDIVSGEVRWLGRGIVNPFADGGGLVDLKAYPRLGRYLEERRDVIARRHCAQKSPDNWYRTIDRITPSLTWRPKLLIPDIKGEAHIVYEQGELYPHHNLYYVTSNEWELRALQAVLLSAISRLFVTTYSTKMRGGYLRFQAQYLRRIRIPRWSDVSGVLRKELTEAAIARDIHACNNATFRLYGLNDEEQATLGGNGTR